MASGEVPGYLLLFGILILLVVVMHTMIYRNGFEDSIAAVLLVSGLAIVLMFCYGVIAGVIQGFSLTILLPAFLATGLGSVAPIDLETRQYSRSQIVQVTQMVGSIGLAIGLAIGLLAIRANLRMLT